MSKSKKTPFSLEEALKEIRITLDSMRENQTDFDQNIELFQKGTGLIQQSRTYLDESELLLKKLIETENGVKEVDA